MATSTLFQEILQLASKLSAEERAALADALTDDDADRVFGGESEGEPGSLEDLAVSQGVHAVDDLDTLGALWPADDDPEALDAFIDEQRVTRRRVARSRAGV